MKKLALSIVLFSLSAGICGSALASSAPAQVVSVTNNTSLSKGFFVVLGPATHTGAPTEVKRGATLTRGFSEQLFVSVLPPRVSAKDAFPFIFSTSYNPGTSKLTLTRQPPQMGKHCTIAPNDNQIVMNCAGSGCKLKVTVDDAGIVFDDGHNDKSTAKFTGCS